MIAGRYYAFTTYWYEDAWMLKVDEEGNELWPAKQFGISNRNEQAFSVAATPDGGYVLTGYRQPPGDWVDTKIPWLIKTDGFGNEEWI